MSNKKDNKPKSSFRAAMIVEGVRRNIKKARHGHLTAIAKLTMLTAPVVAGVVFVGFPTILENYPQLQSLLFLTYGAATLRIITRPSKKPCGSTAHAESAQRMIKILQGQIQRKHELSSELTLQQAGKLNEDTLHLLTQLETEPNNHPLLKRIESNIVKQLEDLHILLKQHNITDDQTTALTQELDGYLRVIRGSLRRLQPLQDQQPQQHQDIIQAGEEARSFEQTAQSFSLSM